MIRNFFRFIAGLFLFIIVVCFLNKQLVLNPLYDVSNFQVKECKTLILGDSHIQCSLNPEYLKNSINMSLSGENYLFTYLKLAMLLQVNPQIQNIIIGYEHHSLSMYALKKNNMSHERYFMLIDDAAYKVLPEIENNRLWDVLYFLKYSYGLPIEYKTETALIFHSLFKQNIFYEYPFVGGFYSSQKSNLQQKQIEEKIALYFGQESISERMQEYLEKILKLCQEKKIPVFLLTSPVHLSHKKRIPPIMIKKHQEIGKAMENKYENVFFHDFSDFFFPDDHYGDGDHLNVRGAQLFSTHIKKSFFSGLK
ncbi:MAG: hypothetical protein HUU50_17850 [Candidatus Brocadiae bacterium]|nr:hypothetical protein [Candidatus Brocadiia bacterium]